MPDEPNQKMDALLKAYAEKRRDEAGAPLEMHPATRKMLQAEVARTLGKEAPAEPRRRLTPGFWVRFALGAAAVVILAVAISRPDKPVQQVALTADKKAFFAAPPASPAPVAMLEAKEQPTRRALANNGPDAGGVNDSLVNESLAKQAEKSITVTGNSSALGDSSWDGKRSTSTFTVAVTNVVAMNDLIDRQKSDAKKTDGFVSDKSKAKHEEPANYGVAFSDSDIAAAQPHAVTNHLNLRVENSVSSPVVTSSSPVGELAKGNNTFAYKMPALATPTPVLTPDTPAQKAAEDVSKDLGLSGRRDANGFYASTRAPESAPISATAPAAIGGALPAAASAPGTPPTAPLASMSQPIAGQTATPSYLGSLARVANGSTFQRLDDRSQMRRNMQSPPVPQLLNLFRISRHGDSLEVVDDDGSIYRGQVLKERGRVATKLASREREVDKESASPRKTAAEAIGKGAALNDEVAANEQSFSFRVSGTNLRLKKNVVFTGKFLPERTAANGTIQGMVQNGQFDTLNNGQANNNFFNGSNNANRLPPSGSQLATSTFNKQANGYINQQSFLNNRISGTVKVGRGTEIPIEALQSGP